MVTYQEWTSILFDEYADAEATRVISVAGREWRKLKDELKAASESEARDHARSL